LENGLNPENLAETSEKRLERERSFHNEIFSSMKRQQLSGLYAIAASSEESYYAQVSKRFAGADILEYGCGPHTFANAAATGGAKSVLGIDISDTAIETSRNRCTKVLAAQPELLEKVTFERMDAEALTSPNSSFDLVFGTAILHHLDLKRSFSEINRVLRPGGQAVFLEPLGHNPAINWYRRRTPELRTPDEHPFMQADFDLLNKMFAKVEIEYFHLTALAMVPFAKYPLAVSVARYLDKLDRLIFKLIPPLRKHAWSCVLILTR
jgi:SAM-dependent methyltransferase